jgi:hypothetical protein
MTLTIRQIMDSGHWDDFCKLRGWDPWIVNEGRADSSEEVELEDAEVLVLLGVAHGTAGRHGARLATLLGR